MIVMIWLAAILAYSQSGYAQEIPVKLLQEDFQIMRQALEEAHGGLYRYTSKRKMDRIFDRAYRKIDHPMSDLEFWRLAGPVVGQIKCGHTGLWFPKRVQIQLGSTLPLLPLEVRDFADHVYVYRDFSHPGSALEGCKLLSINDVPVGKFLGQLGAVFAGDGNSRTAKAWFMGVGRVFGMQLYAQGIESPFRVTYRNRNGKRQTVELAGMTGPDWDKTWKARYATPDPPNADLKLLDAGKIAVLTIRGWFDFADEDRKLKFSDFLKASFAQMHDQGTSDLIIDIRDNGGGLDSSVYELFSFLWNKPFHYYRDIICNGLQFDFFKYDPDAYPVAADAVERRADGKFHFVKHSGLGLYQPQEPQFTGRVFVIMNGASFSSSSEFLSLLHFYKRAKFIGEESAGGYYGSTSGRFVHPILPNSKVELCFGLLTFYQAVSDYKHPGRGVLPDHPVTHSISDLLAGRDRDMELALSLARNQARR
jgi:C-terminal processing protease CtpA/Prc